jgi:hypothetical protein
MSNRCGLLAVLRFEYRETLLDMSVLLPEHPCRHHQR